MLDLLMALPALLLGLFLIWIIVAYAMRFWSSIRNADVDYDSDVEHETDYD